MKSNWQTFIMLGAILIAVLAAVAWLESTFHILPDNSPPPHEIILYPAITASAPNFALHYDSIAACRSSGISCRTALLRVINMHRAQLGVPPLVLDHAMTSGANGCPGAQGHAKAMATQGVLQHIFSNPAYSYASFYADIWPGCIASFSAIAENIGAATWPNEWDSIAAVDTGMMDEPWTPGCDTDRQLSNHHCTLVSDLYHKIGIGIVVKSGQVWLTEDFSA